MYSVSFVIKNSPVAMIFTYKAFKSADELFVKGNSLLKTDSKIEVQDDFDMKSAIDMESVACVNFSSYEREMAKNGEIHLLQAKADLKTQTNAKQDIGLRMLGDAANRADDGLIPGEHKLKVS